MTSLTTTTPTELAIETTAEIANGNDAKATNTKKRKKDVESEKMRMQVSGVRMQKPLHQYQDALDVQQREKQ